MRCVLVSHFHWDREWYRTFEEFRSRLVGAIDTVLELCAVDPGYRFVLDGQTIVIEDYLAVRPERRGALEAAIRDGRLGVGPWYVQPDSLLPSGEAHVRNLLLGQTVAAELGGGSRVAYVPDSFGHPAQFPQIFAGFGLGPFLYWRGNGDEIDTLGPVWRWASPDGSTVVAWHLADGYFAAAGIDAEPESAPERLAVVADRLAAAGHDPVLLMNGFDHLPPDARTRDIAENLARRIGAPVTRALLDEAASMLDGRDAPVHEGPLLGARVANLLPGVWSSRMPLKLRNRRCEALLEGWAEPWAALGAALGLGDERPALQQAWRALLQNQAHDSIGGCSLDRVHAQMQGRFDTAEGLAETTTNRVLERIAGRGVTGALGWTDEHDIVVFNPSAHPRTGVVRASLDAYPPWRVSIDRFEFHPITTSTPDAGFTVAGAPTRVIVSDDHARVQFLPEHPPLDLEFVATDVPAFGCRRYPLRRGSRSPDVTDDGAAIGIGDIAVRGADDGTLEVRLGDREYRGLCGVEDQADRGDSYDFDPLDRDASVRVTTPGSTRRLSHETGIQRLRVDRTLVIPAGLDDAREHRVFDTVECPLVLEALVAPGVPWVEVTVTLDNQARDHRLRLCFPTGAPAPIFEAATTFDVATRTTALPDASKWLHPAPPTFPHQGWVAANGLVVGAPGLPEAEVTPDGTIVVTLVRAIGWLARFDIGTRPVPAGPQMQAPGAQVAGRITAHFVLARDPSAVRAAELGLRAVLGGPEGRLDDGRALLGLEPRPLILSACKPAERGDGLVARVHNPTDARHEAILTVGFGVRDARAVRLDETPSGETVVQDGHVVRFPVPAHAVRTVHIVPA